MSDKTTDQLVDDLVSKARYYGACLARGDEDASARARESVRQARKTLDARLDEMRRALATASGG